MDLTGKCKEDFLIWYFNTYLKEDKYCLIKDVEAFFKSVKPTFQNALIIEFFDSFDMKIGYIPIIGGDFETYVNVDKYDVYNIDHRFETRQKATEQAIKKADEIYNNLFLPK